MSKVTVIMPSLNVAKYITECMDSVLNQTLQDIEVLAIDAGSTDGTLEILQDYACKDLRVQVIVSDKKSYGYQVNRGISLAKGEYIGIVETDDFIEPDMLETLYAKAVEINADYVKGTAQTFMDISSQMCTKAPIVCVSDLSLMNTVICPKEHPELFVTDRFLWMGIYRADFVKKIKLNETPGAAFQDIGFAFQIIQNAEKAVYLDKNVYFYRQDNLSASSHDARAFRYLEAEYTYVKQFLEGKSKEWYKAYYEKMLNQCLGRFAMMGTTDVFWNEYYDQMLTIQSWLRDAVTNGFLEESGIGSERWRKLQCYLKSPEAVYEDYYAAYRTKVKEISELFGVIGKQQVVVFGCGGYGKFFHELLESVCPGQIVSYTDNNKELWNTALQGIKVLPPDEAAQQFRDAVFVIANLRSSVAIHKQLEELGITDEKICLYQQAPDRRLFQTLKTKVKA